MKQIGLILILIFPLILNAKNEGKQIFKQKCAACHSIGEGKRVGPDLKGITKKRNKTWLYKFIQSSKKLIESGDSQAREIFEKFNKMTMPDQDLNREQIDQILNFISQNTPGGTQSELENSPQAPKSNHRVPPSSILGKVELIEKGQNYFQGSLRFKNRGPACNSCHHVKNDSIIGGGVLAKDLTRVFSRMGHEGLKAILDGPPFPVMDQAYKNKSLTQEEVLALSAFFKDADKKHAFQKPNDYGIQLVGYGFISYLFLLGLFSVLWRKRREKSVNHHVFKRQ